MKLLFKGIIIYINNTKMSDKIKTENSNDYEFIKMVKMDKNMETLFGTILNTNKENLYIVGFDKYDFCKWMK